MALQCPLLRKGCVKDKCMFWIQVRGKHPQSGTDIDMHDCAVRWLPVLLIENSKETRHAAAAVESFRNEQVKGGLSIEHALRQLGETARSLRLGGP